MSCYAILADNYLVVIKYYGKLSSANYPFDRHMFNKPLLSIFFLFSTANGLTNL